MNESNYREGIVDGVRKTLERAADLIEERGWRQGSYQPSNPKALCLTHAIQFQLEPEYRGYREVALMMAEHRLNVLYPLKGRTRKLYNWNDQKTRTQEDVTFFLRQTAKELL